MRNVSKNLCWRTCILLTVSMLLTFGVASSAFGQATSITPKGINIKDLSNGNLSVKWTTGNLGNTTWAEGEWVPYQLIISNVQTNYPGLVDFPDIVMEYDFTDQHGNRFVDLVRSIQVGTTELDDTQAWPMSDGTPFPITTREEIETAQNGQVENFWTSLGFVDLDIDTLQINRDAPPGFGDGTPDDQFHYFYITLQDLLDAGVSTSANTIVIYYQLHESRTFVWFNSLQEQYQQYPAHDWGGYLYSLTSYADDAREGSGYTPGSSGQQRVSFGGGDKTIQIPVPERQPGSVSGLKWRDQNGNGLIDVGEQMLDGWRIYASGTLESIFFETSTLTAGGGLYSFPSLTSNVVWNIYEDAAYEATGEDNYTQTYPLVGTMVGVGTGVPHVNTEYGAVAWDVALTEEIYDQADMNFGNKQCEVALTCPPDITIDCNDPQDPDNTGIPTVESNCPPADPQYSDNIVDGNCVIDGYLYYIERTWYVFDAVGEADSCTQIIYVTDTTPPVITGVGGDQTIECPDEPVFSTPSASDDCTDPSLTYDDVTTPGACPQEYSVTRTWTATDECGNTATASQTITVEDNTPPVITGVGGDATIECPATPEFSTPTAEDLCGPATLTYDDVTTPGACPQEYSVTRTWTAVDDCGNSTTASQTITVEDNTPPVITGVGGDATIECPATPEFSTPSAEDACGPATLTYDDVTTPGDCPQEYSITRTWTAVDDCGNSTTASQTITVEDNTPPVITGVGADATIECPSEPVFSTPSAEDACGPATLTFDDVTTPGACPQEYSVTRTWTAVDDCGNSATASQTITVEDNTAPIITCPGDVDASCESVPDFGEATAEDACDLDPYIYFVDDTTSNECPLQISRTWYAEDACGNSSSCVQSIIIRDETPPTITGVGGDATIECPATPEFSTPTASDNCGTPTVTFDDVTTPGACPQEYSVTRTWTAIDGCGNTATASQTITVEDNTPPVIGGVGSDATIECPSEPMFSTPSAEDLCGPATLTYDDVMTPGACPQEYSVTRTWTAVDDCGNSATASQTITVEDNTPPVISCPSNVDASCENVPDFGEATAEDACDLDPYIYFVDDTTSTECPLQISRTWYAEDACGNSSSCVQSIIIRDEIPPTITGVGDDMTIECPAEPEFSTPTASDNCGTPTLAFNDVTTPGDCPQEYSVTRTWTATDDCGNTATASQTITVVDTTPPVISGVGDDATIECPAEPEFSTPTAEDACGDATLTFEDETTPGNCPQAYSITRTWTATDDCGNSSTASQTITVEDNTPPTITCAADSTIPCDGEVVFTPPEATDECDPDPDIILVSTDSTAGPGAGEMTYTRTWYAEDECGNTSDECSQSIIREACPEGCTFTMGGWGSGCPDSQQGDPYSTQPGCIRDYYFGYVYPGGEVVIGDASGYTARWTSAAAIEAYLPAGTTPGVLTANLVDPLTTPAGVLAGQVLALTLNVDYSCAGVFEEVGLSPAGFCYSNDVIGGECGVFAGLTVGEFLALANQVLSGNTSVLDSYGASIGDVNYTATCLNELHDGCDPFANYIVVRSMAPQKSPEGDQVLPKEATQILPKEFSLEQNTPNPFNPVTDISFALPFAANVKLDIYNIMGQKVVTLIDAPMDAGYHSVTWNASSVASGMYFYRLQAGSFAETKKMLLLK